MKNLFSPFFIIATLLGTNHDTNAMQPVSEALSADCWVAIFNHLPLKDKLNLALACTALHTLYTTRATIESPAIKTEPSPLEKLKNNFLNIFKPTPNTYDAYASITKKIETNQINGTLTITGKNKEVVSRIFESLEKNRTITTLDLSKIIFSHDDVPTFLNAYICHQVPLKKLILSSTVRNNCIDAGDIYQILQSIPTLEEFEFMSERMHLLPILHSKDTKILNSEEMAPIGERFMRLKKVTLKGCWLITSFTLLSPEPQWLIDALKKNRSLEELTLHGGFLIPEISNVIGLCEAADQPENPLKLLDLRFQLPNNKNTPAELIPAYKPKRSTLTILFA